MIRPRSLTVRLLLGLIVPLVLRLIRKMRMEVEANERRKSAGFGS